MEIRKVNIQSKLNEISDFWNPKIVGEMNGQFIKLAKFKGNFVRHKHEQEDELFFVISGTLYIELTDKTHQLNPGDFIIIPKGTQHKPYAPEIVEVMLFEPGSTINTGDKKNEFTIQSPEKI